MAAQAGEENDVPMRSLSGVISPGYARQKACGLHEMMRDVDSEEP